MNFSGWANLQHAIDMAPYCRFYQRHVNRVVKEARGGHITVVEAGVRNGCSARIMAEELDRLGANFHLHLIDPFPKPDAVVLNRDERITFHGAFAEKVADVFENHSIDLLHIDADIDGNHPYHLSYVILLAFWNKLKPNGRVIFHDCTVHFPGIYQLVTELRESGWSVEYCVPEPRCPIAAPAIATRMPLDENLDITVVIPIIKDKWLPGILNNMRANTVKPIDIIIIDNGAREAKETCESFPDLPIRYLKQDKNLGVNASWNLGLREAKTELVSILNDDLVLPDRFFEAIQGAFRSYARAGFVIPSTVGPPLRLSPHKTPPWIVGKPGDVLVDGNVREAVPLGFRDGGWCMTVRKSIVPEIPNCMHTFCGDDFIFRAVQDAGYWPLKLTKCRVFHYVGISQDLKEREQLKLPPLSADQQGWFRIQRERANANRDRLGGV